MDSVGTDPLCDSNFRNWVGNSGKLNDRWSKDIVGLGEKIPAVAPADMMLSNVVIGVIVGSSFGLTADALSTKGLAVPPKEAYPSRPEGHSPPRPGSQQSSYKARPLNGIWATAPYLHNGSVPSLYDLLQPAQSVPGRSASVPANSTPVGSGSGKLRRVVHLPRG